jgi:hypothetical protein
MRYKHVLVIEIETQFPEEPKPLEHLIQSVIGPWCLKVEARTINIPIKETE